MSKLLNYDKWETRTILVINMQTESTDLQDELSMMKIPHDILDCEDEELEEKFKKGKYCGIIISGGGYDTFKPSVPKSVLESKVPILGICYGHEMLGELLGSKLVDCNPPMGEMSTVMCKLYKSKLFSQEQETMVQMHHVKMLDKVPEGATIIASTDMTFVAGFEHAKKKMWGLQFHPERGFLGGEVFKNFYKVCHKDS
jgi:GMP synthase (glutamine-hydrolysing)